MVNQVLLAAMDDRDLRVILAPWGHREDPDPPVMRVPLVLLVSLGLLGSVELDSKEIGEPQETEVL